MDIQHAADTLTRRAILALAPGVDPDRACRALNIDRRTYGALKRSARTGSTAQRIYQRLMDDPATYIQQGSLKELAAELECSTNLVSMTRLALRKAIEPFGSLDAYRAYIEEQAQALCLEEEDPDAE